MNHLEIFVRRLRLLAVAAAALGLLLIPSAASAKRHDRTARDRNHDGIPDKWEKRFHLSTKQSGVGKADPDKDGLNNRAEWRSGTNPKDADTNNNGVGDASEDGDNDGVDNGNEAREKTDPRKADSNHNGVKDGKEDADHDKLSNAGEDQASTDPINPDSDGDGIKDGDEHTGKIVSFDGTTLTISVFGGASITGTVDENTYIDCGNGTSSDDSSATGDGSGTDPGADDTSGDATSGDGSVGRVTADDSTDTSTDDPTVDDGSGDDPSVDDGTTDPGAGDGSGDGTSSGGGSGCTADSLKVGAVVNEAAITAAPDGTFFDSIELAP
jgi:hypothetical protein